MVKLPKRFGWIATALADKGYQQRDLAKAWDIDDAVVTRFIATGKPDLTPERMVILARMLGMDYNEIMVRMYENLPPRRVTVAEARANKRGADDVEPTKPNTIETIINQIEQHISSLRKLMPRARINFNIDWGQGANNNENHA